MKNKLITAIGIVSLLFATNFSAYAQSGTVKVLHDEIVSDLKDNILSFWEKYSVDPAGGFYGTVERDGTPVPDAPKGGVLNARILWTFSHVWQ